MAIVKGFDARKQLEDLMLQISVYNDEKAQIIRAWEGEKERLNDPEMEKPSELLRINKSLGALYARKEYICRAHPHLDAEFGGKKKGASKSSPLGTSPQKFARRNEKKAKYLANREARKAANQAMRSQRGR